MPGVAVVGKDWPHLVFEEICVHLEEAEIFSATEEAGADAVCDEWDCALAGSAISAGAESLPSAPALTHASRKSQRRVSLRRRDLWRHLPIPRPTDRPNQQTRVRVAGNDDRTVLTAFAYQSIRIQSQAATRHLIVTFQAVGLPGLA